MTDLKSFTKDELLKELESREKHTTNSSEEHFIYIGIVDDEGVEGMTLVEKAENLRLDQLQLRARFNSHRNPIVYSVKMPKKMGEIMGEIMGGNERNRGKRSTRRPSERTPKPPAKKGTILTSAAVAASVPTTST